VIADILRYGHFGWRRVKLVLPKRFCRLGAHL